MVTSIVCGFTAFLVFLLAKGVVSKCILLAIAIFFGIGPFEALLDWSAKLPIVIIVIVIVFVKFFREDEGRGRGGF